MLKQWVGWGQCLPWRNELGTAEFQAAAGGLKGRGWGGIGDGFLVTCQHHSNSRFLPSWQTPGGKWAIINSFRHQPIFCSHLFKHISINWNKLNLLFFSFCIHPSIHSSVCSIHVHQGTVYVGNPQVLHSQVGCPCEITSLLCPQFLEVYAGMIIVPTS